MGGARLDIFHGYGIPKKNEPTSAESSTCPLAGLAQAEEAEEVVVMVMLQVPPAQTTKMKLKKLMHVHVLGGLLRAVVAVVANLDGSRPLAAEAEGSPSFCR